MSALPLSGWEEGGSTGDEAGQPLLDKTDKAAVQRQSTVAMLLSYSAQDTPLLIVAFLAGDFSCRKMPARLPCTYALLLMHSARQLGGHLCCFTGIETLTASGSHTSSQEILGETALSSLKLRQ